MQSYFCFFFGVNCSIWSVFWLLLCDRCHSLHNTSDRGHTITAKKTEARRVYLFYRRKSTNKMIFSVRRPQNFISHKVVTRHRLSCDNSQEKWKLNVCGCNIIYSADLIFFSSSSLELAAGIRARFYTNLRIVLNTSEANIYQGT